MGFAEEFIRGHQAGAAILAQRQEAEGRAQDRQRALEMHKYQLAEAEAREAQRKLTAPHEQALRELALIQGQRQAGIDVGGQTFTPPGAVAPVAVPGTEALLAAELKQKAAEADITARAKDIPEETIPTELFRLGLIPRGQKRYSPDVLESATRTLNQRESNAAAVRAAGIRAATTQGKVRNVTSGDARRIAEMDSAQNDLIRLYPEVSKTGSGSALGAAMPNAVTEIFGWGADSKARKAQIDLVKQTFGKTLEGGVLRKEDEIKYKDIIPTIDDPPQVALRKLRGMFIQMKNNRSDMLDALVDAGYDTSAFEARPEKFLPDGGSTGGAGGRFKVQVVKP